MESVAYRVRTLTLAWIKAHVNTTGNEEADKAAKEGTHLSAITLQTFSPWSSIQNKIEEYCYGKWNFRWNVTDTCRHTKCFYGGPDKNKTKGVIKLPRLKLSLFVEALTGHNWLSYHQNKINENISKICRLCNAGEETFTHLITTCPVLRQMRTDIFLDKQTEPNNEWSIKGVNKFINSPTVNSLLTDKTNHVYKEIIFIDHAFSSSD